jgi:trehalose synthase
MKNITSLDRYAPFVERAFLDEIHNQAKALSGINVLHFNTTEKGGGVAEVLEALTPITEAFNIRHTRKVIQLDNASNRFTTRLVDLLQGNEPGTIPTEEREEFLDAMRQALKPGEANQADLYFIHDFQLAPLATLYPWMKPALWFCHIDTARPNHHAEHYIRQFLDAYDLYVFNTQASIFEGLPPEKTQVITLGIDPFNPKHLPLSREEGMQLLQRCGIHPERPLITQVSRFDRWKNPWQAIDIYRHVKQRIPSVQLALVGAMEAQDDINAITILNKLREYAGDDPAIHLLYDPAKIRDQEVNAFQRYSSVILQRSLHEGFGLTVTEAMWKCQPVVGTSATGLRAQIIDGYNGYIADDTETAASRTCELIEDRALWQKLGEQAHEHVQHHFLLPMMIKGYLDALVKAYHNAQRRSQSRTAR